MGFDVWFSRLRMSTSSVWMHWSQVLTSVVSNQERMLECGRPTTGFWSAFVFLISFCHPCWGITISYLSWSVNCQVSLSVNSCCCYCWVEFHFVYIGDFSPPDGVHAIVAPPKRALMASISISSSQKSKTKSRILAPIHVESVNCSGLRDPGWLTYLGIVEFTGNRLLNGVFFNFSSDGFLTCPTSAKLNSIEAKLSQYQRFGVCVYRCF